MPESTAQLDYAPVPVWHRRRRAQRWVISISLLVLGIWGGPQAYTRIQILRYQRQCFAYTGPGGQIVYDDGAGTVCQPGMVVIKVPPQRGSNVVPSPTVSSTLVARRLPCWDRLSEMLGLPPAQGAGAVLYLHAARTSAGAPGLVVVLFNQRRSDRLDFSCYFVEPATLTSSARVRSNTYYFPLAGHGGRNPLKLYEGQSRAELSQFTIGYDSGSESGEIKGTIDEGGTVHLEAKDGLEARNVKLKEVFGRRLQEQ